VFFSSLLGAKVLDSLYLARDANTHPVSRHGRYLTNHFPNQVSGIARLGEITCTQLMEKNASRELQENPDLNPASNGIDCEPAFTCQRNWARTLFISYLRDS
jgi:hypothetical protein